MGASDVAGGGMLTTIGVRSGERAYTCTRSRFYGLVRGTAATVRTIGQVVSVALFEIFALIIKEYAKFFAAVLPEHPTDAFAPYRARGIFASLAREGAAARVNEHALKKPEAREIRLREITRARAIKIFYELDFEILRLPRNVRVREVRDEPPGVFGEKGRRVSVTEGVLRDRVDALPDDALAQVAQRVQVLVELHVKHVGLPQRGVGLLDPLKGHLVHDDDVRADRVEGTEEAVWVVAEVGQAQHHAAAAHARGLFHGCLDHFEDIGQCLSVFEKFD